MTDDEFKKHLYKRLEEDKRNEGVLTTRLYNNTAKKKPTRKTAPKNR